MTINTKHHIVELINKLGSISVIQQLPNSFTVNNIITLNDKEIKSLAGYSSILSLSDIADDISLSYEIITRLLELTNGECKKIIAIADVVLSRIGNFPGRKLLHSRHANLDEIRLSPSLRLECIARESENTFFTGESDDGIILTDFQYKLLDSLENENALSVSAPTSAGKSFILNLDLIRKIRSKAGQSIVYIVPTRALIA